MKKELTYTPGPWSHDDGHIFSEVNGRKYNSIATVHEIYKNDGTPECNANAKLIAAAPNLLKACELHPDPYQFKTMKEYLEAYGKWREKYFKLAITKATE